MTALQRETAARAMAGPETGRRPTCVQGRDLADRLAFADAPDAVALPHKDRQPDDRQPEGRGDDPVVDLTVAAERLVYDRRVSP